MTQVKDTIFFSARSIDEVNVQVMMEKLGGGGHRTIAGAQLKDATMEEAREKTEGHAQADDRERRNIKWKLYYWRM